MHIVIIYIWIIKQTELTLVGYIHNQRNQDNQIQSAAVTNNRQVSLGCLQKHTPGEELLAELFHAATLGPARALGIGFHLFRSRLARVRLGFVRLLNLLFLALRQL